MTSLKLPLAAKPAFTATLVGICIQEGRLDWETSLYDVFSGPCKGLDEGWKHVTIQKLLSHRSGLSDEIVSFLAATRDSHASPRAQRAAYVRAVLLHSSPPSDRQFPFEYRNINYVLLAAILEQITDRPYEELARDKLFVPLGMKSAGFGTPGSPDAIDQPFGHGGRRLFGLPVGTILGETSFGPGQTDADFPLAGDSAGLAHVNMRDWAQFVTMRLRSNSANPNRELTLLQAKTADRLQGSNGSGAKGAAGAKDYGGGWSIGTRP